MEAEKRDEERQAIAKEQARNNQIAAQAAAQQASQTDPRYISTINRVEPGQTSISPQTSPVSTQTSDACAAAMQRSQDFPYDLATQIDWLYACGNTGMTHQQAEMFVNQVSSIPGQTGETLRDVVSLEFAIYTREHHDMSATITRINILAKYEKKFPGSIFPIAMKAASGQSYTGALMQARLAIDGLDPNPWGRMSDSADLAQVITELAPPPR